MYGKLFETMYTGTLYGHWQAIVTFQQMIVLADADGIVDMTPQAICAHTSIPLEIIEAGLKKLAESDQFSRTPGEEGRRIVCIDEHRPWGWQIVNYLKYKNLKDSDEVRAQNRIRAQRFRDKRNGSNAASREVTPANTKSRHTDTDIDIDTRNTTAGENPPARFHEFKESYPKRAGNNPWNRALRAYRARLRGGCSEVEILEGALRYSKFCSATGKTGTEIVMQAATFCGPDKPFLQSWEVVRVNGGWDKTEAGTIAKGEELGIFARPGESMQEYRGRIWDALAA